MILNQQSAGTTGSFKLGYSRGLPTHLAPKLFDNKKTEEYFVGMLYAQISFYNKVQVVGIEVCDDDSNKGADVMVKILNSAPKEVQITRFTLTDYIRRRKLAEDKVNKLVDFIITYIKVDFPVNISFNTSRNVQIPFKSQKVLDAFAKQIAKLITDNYDSLKSTEEFINCKISDLKMKEFSSCITLQRVPEGFYSNFFGRDNIFIDLDFDNVIFSNEDIENECINIYNKKNGGKSKVLLIWADTWEIMREPKLIIEKLKCKFESSSFDEVFFFNFYNRLDLYLNQPFGVAQIK